MDEEVRGEVFAEYKGRRGVSVLGSLGRAGTVRSLVDLGGGEEELHQKGSTGGRRVYTDWRPETKTEIQVKIEGWTCRIVYAVIPELSPSRLPGRWAPPKSAPLD